MAKIRTIKRSSKWSYAFEMGIVNGKRKTCQKSGFETKKEAYDAGVIAYDKYLHGGIAVNDGKITFADFLDSWFEKDCKPNIRHHTYQNYEIYIRLHIKPDIGSYKMRDLAPAIMDDWVKKLVTKNLSADVKHAIFTVVKKALNYAVYPAQIITVNPAQYIKFPKIKSEKLVKRVIIDDITKIKENLPNHEKGYYIPITIAYYTGMRIGEIMGLTWKDVDFKKGLINVNKQVCYMSYNGAYKHFVAPTKTQNSIRTILIGKQLLQELKNWLLLQKENKIRYGKNYIVNYGVSCDLAQTLLIKKTFVTEDVCNKYDFICTNKYGELLSRGTLNYFSHNLKKRGIIFNFHSLRHTQATLAIENGAKIVDVASRLGDTIATVQNTYTHDTMDMQKETVEIFENIGRKVVNADK